MHHLVIGEGQIGRAVIDRALADGDTVTVLRRTPREPAPGVRRVAGDLLDPQALTEALEGAEAIHASFHTVYDARAWRRELPRREKAVLDAAAERGIPVVFPESMYGFQGEASDLVEGAGPSPRDAKGEVRIELLAQRRAHPARTVSVVASDLVGPTAVGTGAAVASAMVIERIVAGSRPIIYGDPTAPHTLTHIPDLAAAMLHAGRHAERLTGAGSDVVLHAPSAPARPQTDLLAEVFRLTGAPPRRPLRIPLVAMRALSGVNTFARELAGISGLWFAPSVLRPGILTLEEGLEPTSWEEAVRQTVEQARTARAQDAPQGSGAAPRGSGAAPRGSGAAPVSVQP
ncbi:NAD-dependent epimerase/dehydratase family protein [Brachybacterium sp. P6-10-X1]|uniref:NAD-dependent epimerase/dehydratase family protein n=1 Tax=Brachybacterium sp. P6-10-X1 TaxID=1903186 RepID=UPI0009F86693|nr:NAD-dependent epimerase/dehydratase family protein [Brachybacterium sp. P6-10-X1]